MPRKGRPGQLVRGKAGVHNWSEVERNCYKMTVIMSSMTQQKIISFSVLNRRVMQVKG